ncbi:MAG: valine--tRNA ligase [Woeseiaceae bacterium]
MDKLPKQYEPAEVEKKWGAKWIESGAFAAADRSGKPPYTIVIPPPNVTGALHIGHALNITLQDILIRYKRMDGFNALWMPCTDHAFIATQIVVERRLMEEKIDRRELGREKFVERVWEWKAESGGTIVNQLKSLGASCDWDRERFTMDEGLSRAVREVFVSLYEEGLIYKGEYMINWCPRCHTALSDLEVEHHERDGHMWHIRYPLADGDKELIIATTRPETMLGDTAVAVHPDDGRYKSFIGKSVVLPIANRKIPVIADEYVDMEFGSGALKITPAHDPNDFIIGERHGLERIKVIADDGTMSLKAGERYAGEDRFEARKDIVKKLEADGLLVRVEGHMSAVGSCYRCHTIVEPNVSMQWFVKIAPLAEPAIKAVEEGRVRFIPGHWENLYYEWMRNIRDWCVSRQIWWGHRIPAWTCGGCGEIMVLREDPAECSKCGGSELEQETDVLDTWFSSALWPFSTLGWPEKTEALKTFYPTSVLVTSFDIIFFWVARMIMMGLKFMDDVPFHEVYIHGLIRDQDGQKMSKSKGNVLDPLDLIDGVDLDTLLEKRVSGLMQDHLKPRIEAATRKQYPDGIPAYGADALRFTFASLATTGRDIRFDLGRIEGYKNFCNKLWNASRYVLMNTENPDDGDTQFSTADRWILARLNRTIESVHQHFATYRLDLAAQATHEFTWHEFCDWYLELSKPVLQSEQSSDAEKRGTRKTLIEVLETLLRLLHPLIPFVTEEIWRELAPRAMIDAETIMLQPFPQPLEAWQDSEAESEMNWVMQFILGIRQIRGEMDISPRKPLPVLLQNASDNDRDLAVRHEELLAKVGRTESVRLLSADQEPPPSATALLGEMRVLVPLEGIIDIEAERARLTKKQIGLRTDLGKSRGKLDKPDFVNNAPAEVVTKEKERARELEGQISKLREQIEKLENLD